MVLEIQVIVMTVIHMNNMQIAKQLIMMRNIVVSITGEIKAIL